MTEATPPLQKPRKSFKKKHAWWLGFLVLITTTCIASADKLKLLTMSYCSRLKEDLHKKEDELKDIQFRISLLQGKENLPLSADSMAHAIEILSITDNLKKEACDN